LIKIDIIKDASDLGNYRMAEREASVKKIARLLSGSVQGKMSI